MPSGAEVLNTEDFLRSPPNWFKEAVFKINSFSNEAFHKDFLELSEQEQQCILSQNQRKIPTVLNNIMVLLIPQYYSNGAVLEGIDYGDRAPFPDGHHVHEGDLTLLENVFNRGQIYKDSP